MLELLQKSLKKSPVIKKNSYYYFINPITDGIPSIEPKLLQEITGHIVKKTDMNVDKIVSVEAMGIPIGTSLSLKTGIPLSIIRKRKYGLDGEIAVSQSTGYSKGELYINGCEKGDRVIVVDDVISTGGTLKSIIKALLNTGVNICDVVVIIERGDGVSELKETGIGVKTLIKIDVDENGVSIKGVNGG
ncbi:MAG: hypoxanthine/guanine phosphoribosyltransferase [Methanohalobium sp.]|uniref:hypoxanthine/guanine phosphoribosyltransferase n=1 Tax=Methanohalobium sp. TaxID=2837493 RepID=UPI0039783D44